MADIGLLRKNLEAEGFQTSYFATAEECCAYLDGALDCFSYTDGSGDTALIRTFERNWKTEDQVLHYQFHIRQRVSVPGESDYMREMEENHAGIKKQK